MNLFKKIFSSRNKSNPENTFQDKIDESVPGFKEVVGENFKEIINADYFKRRYRELSEKDEILLDGSVKMVDSFFIENNALIRPVETPVNHPKNLDFAALNGYAEFCKRYGFGNIESATQLAFAFSKYMVDNHNMTFYFDSEPEYQYRVFTIKKDINKIILSLYPLEYCLKVISGEKKFIDIVERIVEQENKLPEVPEIIKKYMS